MRSIPGSLGDAESVQMLKELNTSLVIPAFGHTTQHFTPSPILSSLP